MFKIKYVYRDAEGGDGGGGNGGNGGDGGNALSSENWKEFIQEDLRGHESLGKFTDLSALAKSYINAEVIIGKDKMVIPKTDEEFFETYKTLGRPDTPDDYGLEYAEGEGKDPISIGFRDTIHKLGLNKKQASDLHGWYKGVIETTQKQQETDSEEARGKVELELKNEWGEKYKGNVALARRVVETYGDEDFLDFLDDSGLGNDPRMSKFLATIGSKSGEDNLELGNDPGAQTKDQLQEEINNMMATDAYRNKDATNHEITVKKVSQLFNRLHTQAAA